MADYNSKDFDPGNAGSRIYPNGVAVFNNQIFVVGGGNDGPGLLGQSTVSLTSADVQSLPTASWSSAQTKGLPHVDGRCSLVTSGPNMYLLGSGGEGPFAAIFNLQAQSAPGWNTSVSFLQDATGRQVKNDPSEDNHDVDAKPFGQSGILVGCVGIPVNGINTTYFGYYDTSDFTSGGAAWKARWSIYLAPKDLSALGLAVTDPGTNLSMDWFAGTVSQKMQYFLAVFMTPKGSQATVSVLYIFPFSVDASGDLNSFGSTPSSLPAPSAWQIPGTNGGNGCAVRDPGGRINLYYFTGSSTTMQVLLLNTYTFTPGHAPGYQTTTRAVNNNNIAPTVVYWIGPGTNNQAPVYELMFYASDLRAQVNSFGTAQVLPQYANFKPTSKPGPNAVEYIVEGIFDGPFPYPNVNSQTYASDLSAYSNAGTVTYSSSATASVQHEQTFAWTVGVQSQGSFSKGVGPAWDVSVNGGTNWSSGDESGTALCSAQSKSTQLQLIKKIVNPQGSLSSSSVEMFVTPYKFTDANGVLVSGPPSANTTPQAPLSFAVSSAFTDGPSPSFLPYYATPGDLSTYTPEAISSAMHTLGYPGLNYFGDVIVKYAYPFKSGASAIQCGWSNSGFHSEAAFEAMSSSFSERGWTFESSLYAGVSGGGGIDLFGNGDEAQFSAMAGFTISASGSDTDTQGSSWGICLEHGWSGPPPSKAPSAIQNYTFLIVYLPPPSDSPAFWAQEFIKYAPKVPGQSSVFNPSTVDPNSACWRIVYIVTSYVSNDGKASYKYNGKLGQL